MLRDREFVDDYLFNALAAAVPTRDEVIAHAGNMGHKLTPKRADRLRDQVIERIASLQEPVAQSLHRFGGTGLDPHTGVTF